MRDALHRRAAHLIYKLRHGDEDSRTRDALLSDMAAWQISQIPELALLQLKQPHEQRHLDDFTATPTDLFRHRRIATFAASEECCHFISSGTTRDAKGVHHFQNLELYEMAARASAQMSLFRGLKSADLLILAPSASEAPHSSLAFMLDRFVSWYGEHVQYVYIDNHIDDAALRTTLRRSQRLAKPLVLLGTSFAFAHAHAAIGEERWSLPQGSRLMHTGGMKGRAREVPVEEQSHQLAHMFNLSPDSIYTEYGMTELSSQFYAQGAQNASRYRIPGWVRVSTLDPATGQALPAGQVGVLRIDDVANIDSSCMIQTADLGQVQNNEVQLLGRDPASVERGCSLTAWQALREDGTQPSS